MPPSGQRHTDKYGVAEVCTWSENVARQLSIPERPGFREFLAHGVTREMADTLGSWWEDRRGIIQPSEFIVGEDGKIVTSSYSSGPIGRFDAADVAKIINFYESRK